MRPPAPDENARRCGHSLEADRNVLGHRVAVVADPLERERACLGRGGGKSDQGIRGHRGMQIDAIDFDAVVGAGEPPDDVARDQLAQLRAAETGLHCVRGERSEEHTSELQSRQYLVCRLLLEKKNTSGREKFLEFMTMNIRKWDRLEHSNS